MATDDQSRMRFEMLMSEFNQHFEHARHEQMLIVSTQTIFIPIAYGILAYTIGQDTDQGDLILAAIASILIYIFHIIQCERITMRLDLDWERIVEIEDEVSQLTGSTFAWQKKYHTKLAKKASSYHPRYSTNRLSFYNWIAFISGIFRNRSLRSLFLFALIALWMVRLF